MTDQRASHTAFGPGPVAPTRSIEADLAAEGPDRHRWFGRRAAPGPGGSRMRGAIGGNSLRTRLMFAGVGSVLIALCLSAFGLLVLFERHVERRVETELEIYLDQLIAGLERDAEGELVVVRPPADPRFEQPLSGLHWQIIVQPGGAILRSRSLWDHVLALPSKPMIDGAVRKHRLSAPSASTLVALERNVALPASLGGSEIRAVVALDTGDIRAATKAFAGDLARARAGLD